MQTHTAGNTCTELFVQDWRFKSVFIFSISDTVQKQCSLGRSSPFYAIIKYFGHFPVFKFLDVNLGKSAALTEKQAGALNAWTGISGISDSVAQSSSRFYFGYLTTSVQGQSKTKIMHFDRSGQLCASYVSRNTSSCDIINVYMRINSFHANQTVYNSVGSAFFSCNANRTSCYFWIQVLTKVEWKI